MEKAIVLFTIVMCIVSEKICETTVKDTVEVDVVLENYSCFGVYTVSKEDFDNFKAIQKRNI
ncbi:MAG TPA: hypothetical protein VFD80_07780 [Flavobacteriaceae bacterium]|nr:hypothetical protein [Flavobacteriaceae bacterium]